MATSSGAFEIADPGTPVDTSRLQVVAQSDGQLVLRGPSTERGHECLVVAPAEAPTTLAMAGCDRDGTFAAEGAFLAEVGQDGSVSGAVLVPEGATDVLLNGAPVEAAHGVVTFRNVPASVTVVATTPDGRFEKRLVGRGDHDITPGVRPGDNVVTLDE